MLTLLRTNSANEDFGQLVENLDNDLDDRYGEEQAFYNQFNKLNTTNHVVEAFENNVAVGCGAIKAFDSDTMEVKRMFVKTECRGLGIGAKILAELENCCLELNFNNTVLETGIKQPEAVKLYVKCGYRQIPNYGQYKNAASSICFAKDLNPVANREASH